MTGPPEVAGAPAPVNALHGQVALIYDAWRDQTTLRIWATAPTPRPLPWERSGLGPDQCAAQIPVLSREGLIFRDSEAPLASCGGAPLALTPDWSGAWRHVFDGPLPPGTRCEVELEGAHLEVPPLPQTPDPSAGLLRIRWTPDDSDEVRVSVPRSGGEITLCRLEDDGEARNPPGIRRQLSFFSRSRHAVARVEGRAFALSATAGVWMDPLR